MSEVSAAFTALSVDLGDCLPDGRHLEGFYGFEVAGLGQNLTELGEFCVVAGVAEVVASLAEDAGVGGGGREEEDCSGSKERARRGRSHAWCLIQGSRELVYFGKGLFFFFFFSGH